MKTRETKRWLLLIIAFIVACMIWYMVVSRENPKVNIYVGNITVTIRGGSDLHDRGYAYFVEENESVAVEADVAQKKAVLVSSNDFLLSADISDCTEGENTVMIDSAVKNNRSIIGNNYSLKHDSITVRLEKLTEIDVPVKISVSGTLSNGFASGDAVPAQSSIKVRVPESMKDQEFYAIGAIDITGAEDSVTDNITLTLSDASGNAVDVDALQLLAEQDSVEALVPVGTKTTLTITVPDKNDYTRSDYCCTELSSDMDSVEVIGPENSLDGLEKINITASDMDLNDQKEDFTWKAELNEYLPDGVYVRYAKNRILNVDVTIEKMEKKTFKMSSEDVNISGEQKSAVKILTSSFSVKAGSSSELINSITTDNIKVSLDVSGMSEGTHTVTPYVSFDLDGEHDRIELVKVGTITITVSGS